MTQSPTTEETSKAATLVDAIGRHCVKEKASFHTPGHKGGANFCCEQNLWAMDVTELPGLDELAYANGILAKVQARAAKAFSAQASFISTNGASAALMAAVIACANRGTHILVPRNIHRSVVNALVLTGLEPIWYKPSFDRDWNIWGAVDAQHFVEALQRALAEFLPYDRRHPKIAAAIVVSPTYGGAISPLSALADACHQADIPLIVDEAHGAHAPNAVALGADLVVHSLHKTLSGMTQTGLIHCSARSLVDPDDVRLALNMLQSSSPNYVLMASIEAAINEFTSNSLVSRTFDLANSAKERLSATGAEIYSSEQQDLFHLLIRVPGLDATELMEQLANRGIFAESILGCGVLLLFGCGSKPADIDLLLGALEQIRMRQSDATDNSEQTRMHPSGATDNLEQTPMHPSGATDNSEQTPMHPSGATDNPPQPSSPTPVASRSGTNARANMSDHSDSFGTQVLLPKLAYFSKTEMVSLTDAIGRISAECVAPCPPGNPVLVPGQRVTARALELCKLPALRVVLESQQGEH